MWDFWGHRSTPNLPTKTPTGGPLTPCAQGAGGGAGSRASAHLRTPPPGRAP